MTFDINKDRLDYDHYARLSEINLAEAVEILAIAQIKEDQQDRDKAFKRNKINISNVLDQSIDNGEISIGEPHDNAVCFDDNDKISYIFSEIFVETIAFWKWALKKKYYLPDEIKQVMSEHETNNKSLDEVQQLIIENDTSSSKLDVVKALRANQIAKIKCQAIAQTLWHNDADLNIEQIIKRYEILEFGDGKIYPGKNTLRDWVSEVDPRPSSGKTGPKKSSEESLP